MSDQPCVSSVSGSPDLLLPFHPLTLLLAPYTLHAALQVTYTTLRSWFHLPALSGCGLQKQVLRDRPGINLRRRSL